MPESVGLRFTVYKIAVVSGLMEANGNSRESSSVKIGEACRVEKRLLRGGGFGGKCSSYTCQKCRGLFSIPSISSRSID